MNSMHLIYEYLRCRHHKATFKLTPPAGEGTAYHLDITQGNKWLYLVRVGTGKWELSDNSGGEITYTDQPDWIFNYPPLNEIEALLGTP